MFLIPVLALLAPPTPPPTADRRPEFERFNRHTRGQGARGTCSAFTVTGALEFALAKHTGHGTDLSVEFLNWASNDAIHDAADGGFFSDLWKGVESHGICADFHWKYADHFDAAATPSSFALADAKAHLADGLALHWIKPWDVNTGLTPEHLAQIKHTIASGWPVCGGFRWPKQVSWPDGVLIKPPPEGVRDGHSVLLVAYRDDPRQPGGGVFTFHNSNDPRHDGQMSYSYAMDYMNDAAWIDAPVPAAAATHETHAAPAQPEFLSILSAPPVGRNQRVSSNQQPDWHTENLDMTWILPGKSIDIPLLEGPGVITHMWFTSHAGWVAELNSLSIRIYWDGRAEPGVEAPLSDFFAVGHGKPAPVESVPVQVSPTGALTCYWRMPFAKSARIVITNDNPDRSTGLYWQIDWTKVDHLADNTPYFHAAYRQEYPARPGHDYTFAKLKGRGAYVGTVMSITSAQDGWFGEGDDFFSIDNEPIPSLQGTGSEDYFNDAWGFRPRTSHWYGSPRWQGDSAGDAGVCYRWHLLDPVWFTTSLDATIEHKGNRAEDTEGFFIERPDFISSVAFWYQEGLPAKHEPLPSWKDRRVPWDHQIFVKAYQQAKATSPAKIRIDTSGLFGARPLILWPNQSKDSTLTIPFQVAEDGRHAVRLTAATGPDSGTFDILIDDAKITTADFRAADGDEKDLLLGVLTLTKGDHRISFRASSDESKLGALRVEMLRLLALPAEAARAQKTHHEAHFVRLGIGRAVYAYRLAFNKVPDSLQDLVDAGIMSDKFLKDENGAPLNSRREKDALVVESVSGEKWTKSWQGLDARR